MCVLLWQPIEAGPQRQRVTGLGWAGAAVGGSTLRLQPKLGLGQVLSHRASSTHPRRLTQLAVYRRAMQRYTKRVAIAAVGVRPWVLRLQVGV